MRRKISEASLTITILFGCLLFTCRAYLSLTCVISAESKSQKIGNTLNKKITRYLTSNKIITQALEEFSATHNVPMGVVAAIDGSVLDNERITIDVSNVTIAEALDEIARQSLDYKWEVIDDVVVFTLKESVDEFLNHILEVKFETFSIEKETPTIQIRKQLLNHPLVADLATKNKMQPILMQLGCGFTSCYIGGNRNYSVTLTDKTLKQILNYLALDSGMRYWKAYRHKEYFSIMF